MFSVIIPLYNKELSIKSTVQSVLNQTFENFEIVIINDGSTDNSIKAVEGISDNRLRLIHQDNQGVSAARNRGIKESKYEWIAFLDGDDLWEPNHLDEISKMKKRFPNEKVYVTSFAYSDKRNVFRHTRQAPISKIINYFKEAIQEELICTGVVVINRNCFDQVGFFNENLNRGEDTDLWIRLAREYSIIKSTTVTAIYRIEAENRTTLSKDLEKTHLYYLNISNDCESDEYVYYKVIILRRLYNYFRNGYFSSFLKLKKKHASITYNDFFKYAVDHIKKRII